MIFLNLTLPPGIRRILLIVPAVMVGLGIQNLFVYFTNTKPVEVSIEQMISNPPSSKWVRVTGGRINLIDAAASEAKFQKKIEKVYIPIHPEGKEESSVSVLLLSTDPEVLAVTKQFHALDEAKDAQVEGVKLAMENARVIRQERPFEGLIQSGLFRDERVIFDIRKTLPNIVKEPIIIEEGKKPTIVEGLVMLLVAFVMTVGILSVPKSRGATPPPLPPTLPR
jgi:hypothetical protein